MMLSCNGCSDAELRHTRNVFHDIEDFHVQVAKQAIKSSFIVSQIVIDGHVIRDEHAVYIASPEKHTDIDERNRIRYFIDGYYANGTRSIFQIDVVVISFTIYEDDKINIKWSITTKSDNDNIYKQFGEERKRLTAAIVERGYPCNVVVNMTLDISREDGTKSQVTGALRW